MSTIRTIATGFALIAGILAFADRADTQEATGKVKAARIFSATTTNSGQPIVLPKSNAEVVVWMYDIPAGSKLPAGFVRPRPRSTPTSSPPLTPTTP